MGNYLAIVLELFLKLCWIWIMIAVAIFTYKNKRRILYRHFIRAVWIARLMAKIKLDSICIRLATVSATVSQQHQSSHITHITHITHVTHREIITPIILIMLAPTSRTNSAINKNRIRTRICIWMSIQNIADFIQLMIVSVRWRSWWGRNISCDFCGSFCGVGVRI